MSDPRTLSCGDCGSKEFHIRFRLRSTPDVDVWAECADCGRKSRALDEVPGARKK